MSRNVGKLFRVIATAATISALLLASLLTSCGAFVKKDPPRKYYNSKFNRPADFYDDAGKSEILPKEEFGPHGTLASEDVEPVHDHPAPEPKEDDEEDVQLDSDIKCYAEIRSNVEWLVCDDGNEYVWKDYCP